MMKKILSVLLVAVLTASTFISMTSFVSADESFTADPAAAERIFGLGLMPHVNKTDYSPDAIVTRGELALILDTISEYQSKTEKSDFTWQFYGNALKDINELKSAPEQAVQRFEDVPATHWAYNTINNVVNSGFMNGVSGTEFMPDGALTTEQIAKTFVVLLGYDSLAKNYGGYPEGYMKVARDLKLLKGIPENGNVTNDVIIHMLDNMLEVRILEFDGIVTKDSAENIVYSGSDETFLTGILGLGKAEGIMSDNSVTSLSGSSRIPIGQFVIDGTKFKAFEDIAGGLYKYIGRETEVYYVLQEGKKFGYIVYAAPTGKDKATVIDAADFAEYNNGTIKYFDNGNVKTIKLSGFYHLIYNGKAKTSYDKTIFDFEDGTITVVEGGASGTDVVLIEDNETWYTSAVDYENSKIFNRIASSLSDSTIAIDDYDFVSIIKADGTSGTFEDIAPGTVLNVLRNGNYISIEICGGFVSGIIEELVNRDGNSYYLVGDAEYKLSDDYNSFAKKNEMKLGTEVTLYLNKFGKVAWVEEGSAGSFKVGFLMNYDNSQNGFEDSVVFMIFDTVDKKANTYHAKKDKIRVSNSKGEEITYTDYDNFTKDHGSYRGIVRYNLDENGEINYIEFPITDLNYAKDNKLMFFADINDEYNDYNLGGKAIINSSCTVIRVDPLKIEDEKSYEIKSATSVYTSKDVKYKAKCYTTRKDSKLAQYIVNETASKSASLEFKYTSAIKMAVVKRVIQTYDDDLGVVDTIKAFDFSNQYTSTPADADLILAEGATVKTIMGHEFNHNLEPGDIIAYGTNIDGHVSEIRVIFDESEPNPDSPYGISGMLTDSKGYFGSGDDAPKFNPNNYRYEGDTTKMPNPYTIETIEGVDYGKNSSSFDTGPFCIQYGFAPRILDGIIEITTQDLSVEEYDQYGDEGKHFIRVWKLPTNTMFINLSGNDDVQVIYTGTTAMADQIRTQEEYKGSCSRIITNSNGGALTRLIVINGQFE